MAGEKRKRSDVEDFLSDNSGSEEEEASTVPPQKKKIKLTKEAEKNRRKRIRTSREKTIY